MACRPKPRDIVIVVVTPRAEWRKATAPALVRELGLSPKVAASWGKVRRSMSPAGLRRKLREQGN
jgi:hypothetical protein